eukprot:366466-Chlamydomonas_euryale.AAC.11
MHERARLLSERAWPAQEVKEEIVSCDAGNTEARADGGPATREEEGDNPDEQYMEDYSHDHYRRNQALVALPVNSVRNRLAVAWPHRAMVVPVILAVVHVEQLACATRPGVAVCTCTQYAQEARNALQDGRAAWT